MSRMVDLMKGMGEASASTLRRFPWMLACAALGTGLAEWSVGSHSRDPWDVIARPFLACILGMPLLFLLRILREQLGTPWSRRPLELVGVGFLLAYGLTLPPHPSHWTADLWIRFFLLLAGLHFAAAVVPFFIRKSTQAFWQFNRRLFLRFFVATLYAGVLTVGLEVALLSISKLFDINFEKAYFELFILMAGIFHPLFFLAGVPDDLAALEGDASYPAGLKAFTQFALAPLVLVYTVILYGYVGKIVLSMSWPHGWVALPVLVLSGIGILAALLLHPLRTAAHERWAGWYCRWFFRVLAPLTILLLLSLRIRIAEYGVTEERYLGVVIGTWIFGVSVLFSLRQSAGIKGIPATLAALCFLSAFGPWSAFAVSLRSQLARLDKALEKSGLSQMGRPRPAKVKISPADYDNLQSLIGYLAEHHGDAALATRFADAPPMQGKNWVNEASNSKKAELLKWLQVERESKDSLEAHINRSQGLPIEGWKVAYPRASLYPGGSRNCGKLKITLHEGELRAAIGQSKAEPLPIQSILKLAQEKPGEHPPEEMFIDWPAASPAFRIYFMEIDGTKTEKSVNVARAEVFVLER